MLQSVPMGARPLATATISFGLVSIPVKLFTTSESGSAIHFNMLHQCGSRMKQQYWCPRCERVVPRDEMVKGYEFAKGRYVTFAPEELKALEEEGSQAIEITEFLPLAEIDPLFFEKAYYLGPDKGGAKPYGLLARAMGQTGRAALARYAARGKQYLVLIRPFEDGLLMQQLRYADEIRSFDEVDRGDSEPTEAELRLAVQLIGQISTDEFRPDQYADQVKLRIEQAVQRKIAGEEAISVEPAEQPSAQIIDLMEALKASLQEAGEEPSTAPVPERRGPKRAKPTGSSERSASRSKATKK
jgi:DNA end-binding protein Ku